MGMMFGKEEMHETLESGGKDSYDGTVRKYREGQPQLVLTDVVNPGEHSTRHGNVNMIAEAEGRAWSLENPNSDDSEKKDHKLAPRMRGHEKENDDDLTERLNKSNDRLSKSSAELQKTADDLKKNIE